MISVIPAGTVKLSEGSGELIAAAFLAAAFGLAWAGVGGVVGGGQDRAVGPSDLEHAVERRAELGGVDLDPELLAGGHADDVLVLLPLLADPAVEDHRGERLERRRAGLGRLAELGRTSTTSGGIDSTSSTGSPGPAIPSMWFVSRGRKALGSAIGVRAEGRRGDAGPGSVPPLSSRPIVSPCRPPSGKTSSATGTGPTRSR